MGPIALFDKSFLQSLNIDESVWFDNFYLANICPLFYVETMADLEKEMSRGKTAEHVVGGIASKTPEMSGTPNMYHMELFLADLFGQKIKADGRPVIRGGRPVKSGGKTCVVIDLPPESKAFNRWQKGEYLQIEREFARQWRAQISAMKFDKSADLALKLGIDIAACKNIEDAYTAANRIIKSKDKPYDLLKFILTSFLIPREYHQKIVERYQQHNFPSLSEYAPYAAHVVHVEIFFHIAVARGFISADRPSNKVDISYLHYLPFCQIFISGDKLHRQSAPLFLREKQSFVWGPDLKADLSALNAHYMSFPDEIKDTGLMSFANSPPKDGEYLTCKLWDVMNPNWRKTKSIETPLKKEVNDKIVAEIKGFTDAKTLRPEEVDFDFDNLDSLSLQRAVAKRKGSWYQVPKDLENDQKTQKTGQRN